MHCLMVKVWYKYEQHWTKAIENIEQLEFVFYMKTDVSPLLEWCSFVQEVRFWYSKGV